MEKTILLNSTTIKILMLGDSSIGKSYYICKYVDNDYTNKSTIGLDFYSKSINDKLRLELWDASGDNKFKSLMKTFVSGCNCLILCFDVTDKISLLNLDKWYNFYTKFNKKKIPIIILGLKCDDQKRLPRKEIMIHIKNNENLCNLSYFEVSTLKNININNPINKLIELYLEKNPINETTIKSNKCCYL
jgi:small GTP-binding protein